MKGYIYIYIYIFLTRVWIWGSLQVYLVSMKQSSGLGIRTWYQWSTNSETYLLRLNSKLLIICSFCVPVINKQILLCERKRHTARRAASAHSVAPDGGWGTPSSPDGGYPNPVPMGKGTLSCWQIAETDRCSTFLLPTSEGWGRYCFQFVCQFTPPWWGGVVTPPPSGWDWMGYPPPPNRGGVNWQTIWKQYLSPSFGCRRRKCATCQFQLFVNNSACNTAIPFFGLSGGTILEDLGKSFLWSHWWRLPQVSEPGYFSPSCFITCMWWIPQIDLWCYTWCPVSQQSNELFTCVLFQVLMGVECHMVWADRRFDVECAQTLPNAKGNRLTSAHLTLLKGTARKLLDQCTCYIVEGKRHLLL